MNILVYFLFALSGFAGLIYEGSWARYLKLFLGHASYGQVLTLCIYMGGLAIGSFIAGKMVEWVKRPLLGYAAVELAIGIGGLVYHPLYNLLTGFFFDSEWIAGLGFTGAEITKVVLATGSTLPIAIAVGMTFPFIAAGLLRKSGQELSLPMLYFTNSLGSAIGILVTSYLLIPELGNHATLCVAASINFLLAAIFGYIGFATSPNKEDDEDDAADVGADRAEDGASRAAEPLNVDYVAEHKLPMPPKNTWLWIAAITGLTSFVYEIVWIRLLSLLMGSSSHSFDQMLSAFILGLAIGSAVSGKLLKKEKTFEKRFLGHPFPGPDFHGVLCPVYALLPQALLGHDERGEPDFQHHRRRLYLLEPFQVRPVCAVDGAYQFLCGHDAPAHNGDSHPRFQERSAHRQGLRLSARSTAGIRWAPLSVRQVAA